MVQVQVNCAAFVLAVLQSAEGRHMTAAQTTHFTTCRCCCFCCSCCLPCCCLTCQAISTFLKQMSLTHQELLARKQLVDLVVGYHFIPGALPGKARTGQLLL